MPVGISFGTATGGNGFDVASTVASIMAWQRAPETAWASRTTALTTQDAVLSTLGTDASALSAALAALTTFDGVFASKVGATSDPTSVVLTNAGSSAQAGTHTLTVQTLAKTSQQYSSAVVSGATLGGGPLQLTLGASGTNPGMTTSIAVSAGETLTQLAAAINVSSAGVTASLISDGSGQRLSLVSGKSGAAGEIAVSGSVSDSNGNALSFLESQAGVDAAYKVDGVALTSGTNTISTALSGVTFNLLGLTSNPVTLQIAADTNAVATALQTFVSAYNTLSSALTAQEGNNASGSAQPLFGSTVISSLQSALSDALNFSSTAQSGSGGSINPVSTASLGLSLSRTGVLSLDSNALGTALTSGFDNVAGFFQSSGSYGQNFVTALNNAGSTGNGTLALALGNNTEEEAGLATNKTNLEMRLSTYQSNLTLQLNTANQILQAIPQQLSSITSLFNAITGKTGG